MGIAFYFATAMWKVESRGLSMEEKQKAKSHQEFYFCGIMLLTAVLAYHTLYFNSVLPELDGWGVYYAELFDRGQVPYRDFAYYLPPLNLLIDWVFWKLSFGYLLAFRGWYLLERLVLTAFLYKFTTRWFRPRFAWIACLTGVCLGASTGYDLCGDYNQTQTLFCVILAYWTARFLEQGKTAESTQRYKYMFLSGIQLSLMLLLKQSLGFAAVVVCLVFLVGYCAAVRDKRFGWYCAATALGAAIPLAVTCVILTANGAFLPFLEQFFGTAGAKGGVGRILTSIRYLAEPGSLWILMAGILLVVTGEKAAKAKSKNCYLVLLLTASILVVSLLVSQWEQLRAAWAVIRDFWPLQLLCVLLLAGSVFFCWCNRRPDLHSVIEWNYALPVIFLFCLMLSCVIINKDGAASEFFYRTGLYDSVFNQLVYLSRYALIVVVILCALPGRGKGPVLPVSALALALCGCVDVYATNMASAGGLVYREMFLTLPVLLLLLFSYEPPRWTALKNYAVCFLCVMLCSLSMLQKYTGAYSWWCGTSHTWNLPARSESVDVDALAGFRLPEAKKQEFEEITRIIEENGTEDSTVWGFPHVKIFNILTDHYDVTDPAPVLFYDVCSDEMAEKEVEWLRQSPPDFVIWCDIPQCLEVHEAFFRNGSRMGQRDIVDWFTEVKSKEYILVGQAENLFVYQLKDHVPVNYTYIQNPDAKNGTTGEY